MLPDLHSDMTRRRPARAAGSGWARGRPAGVEGGASGAGRRERRQRGEPSAGGAGRGGRVGKGGGREGKGGRWGGREGGQESEAKAPGAGGCGPGRVLRTPTPGSTYWAGPGGGGRGRGRGRRKGPASPRVGAVKTPRAASPAAAPPEAPGRAADRPSAASPQPGSASPPGIFTGKRTATGGARGGSAPPLSPRHPPALPPLAAPRLCLPAFPKFNNFQPLEPHPGDSEPRVSSNPRRRPQGQVASGVWRAFLEGGSDAVLHPPPRVLARGPSPDPQPRPRWSLGALLAAAPPLGYPEGDSRALPANTLLPLGCRGVCGQSVQFCPRFPGSPGPGFTPPPQG